MLKIENKIVEPSDIGSPVTYMPPHAKGNANHIDSEKGVISSFNETTIWVRFRSANGESVNPENLVWG